MLNEQNSDDDRHIPGNHLTEDDKKEIFEQIKEELEIIDEPRQERLQNCGQIFIDDYQQQRKQEFFNGYEEYIERLNNFNEIEASGSYQE